MRRSATIMLAAGLVLGVAAFAWSWGGGYGPYGGHMMQPGFHMGWGGGQDGWGMGPDYCLNGDGSYDPQGGQTAPDPEAGESTR